MDWIRMEGPAYWGLFLASFLAVAVWESFAPKRKLSVAAERRWSRHGILLAIGAAGNTIVLRASPIAIAALASNNRFGLLNRPWMPFPLAFVTTILLLDLLQYGIHWTFHHVGFLWRIHTVHHSDPDFDVSTAARFHPLEVLGAQAVIVGMIAVLAPPLSAVFVAEMLKVILNLLEHANASLPSAMERLVRHVLVTPDFHRIHHSDDEWQQSRNLGQIFPWWDRLFGTYLGPRAGQDANFSTGLKGFQNSASVAVGFMLAEPFHAQGERSKEPSR